MSEEISGALDLTRRFLSFPTNTLLLKGAAGSGKTTFCVELMRSLAGVRQVFYLSTRVSYERLQLQYPGIAGVVSPSQIKNIDAGGDASSRFTDIRLGTSNGILEVAMQILSTVKNPLLIFDSWDAIARELDAHERQMVEKTLLAAIDGRSGNAVFVSEETESANLLFATDGALTLSNDLVDDVRIRRMTIDKLRGITITDPVRYFTLQGGRYVELEEFRYETTRSPRRLTPLADNERFFSSGIRAIDAAVGGFRRGSVGLIELTPVTNKQFLGAALGILFLNFLNKGNTGLVGLSADHNEKKVLRPIQPYSDPASLASLQILRYNKVEELVTAYDAMKSKSTRDTVVELDVTFLIEEDDFRSLLALCRRVKEQGDLLVLVTRRVTEHMKRLRAISDLDVRVWQLGKSILSREMITKTPVFAMNFFQVDGAPQMSITQVV